MAIQLAMITSGGLNSVTEASVHGTLVDVRYFVPVYDYRIDPYVQRLVGGYSATDISTVTNSYDLTATGEHIWHVDSESYSLSNDSNAYYIISGGNTSLDTGPTPDIIRNPVVRQTQPINLYNNTPLFPHISASSIVTTPSANANSFWEVYNGHNMVGSNTRPAGDKTDYWKTVDYAAVKSSSGRQRGSFQCRMTDKVGKFKFNKISLYAVKLDRNYSEYGDPFLFAQAILSEPEIKASYDDGGMDEVIIDVQIELTTTSADWTGAIYGTSADYWQRIASDGSLHNSLGTYIGKFAPQDNNTDKAKTVITTYKDLATYGDSQDLEERYKPQLALQYVASANGNGALVGHWVDMKVDENGNFNLQLSAENHYYTSKLLEDYLETNIPKNTMFIPEQSERFYLGAHYNRWKVLYLGNDGRSDMCAGDYCGSRSHTNQDYSTQPRYDLLAIDIHGGGIKLGQSPDTTGLNTHVYGLRMRDRSIKLDGSYYRNTHMLGADIKKEGDDVLVLGTSRVNSNATTSGSHVFLLAGADEYYFKTEFGTNVSWTKDSIYYTVHTSGFCGGDGYFSDTAKLYLWAKGGLEILGGLHLFSTEDTNYGSHYFIRSHRGTSTKKSVLSIVAGTRNDLTDSTYATASDNNWSTPYIEGTSVLELIAGNYIGFRGTFQPVVNATDGNIILEQTPRGNNGQTRTGFSIGATTKKVLDVITKNLFADNVAFQSFDDQIFATYQSVNLQYAVDTTLNPSYTSKFLKATTGQAGTNVSDYIKKMKFARVGDLVNLKFIMDMRLAGMNTNSTAKFSFNLNENITNEKDKPFPDEEILLNIEVLGNPEGSSTAFTSNYPRFYHPISVTFKRTFEDSSDSTEKENVIVVPSFSTGFETDGAVFYNESDGLDKVAIPAQNLVKFYPIKFYVSKGSDNEIDVSDLITYLTNYPTGNSLFLTNHQAMVDNLIKWQGKDTPTSIEQDAIDEVYNDTGTKFYSWDSFKTKILTDSFVTFPFDPDTTNAWPEGCNSLDLQGDGQLYKAVVGVHKSIFGQSVVNYGCGSGALSAGVVGFTSSMLTKINTIKSYIIRLDDASLFSSTLTGKYYIRIASSTVGNTSTSYVNGYEAGTKFAAGGIPGDWSFYLPFIKCYRMSSGVKMLWTFGCNASTTPLVSQISHTRLKNYNWTA